MKFADATGRAPTPWAEGGWERYLETPAEIVEAVDYADGNPRKHDLPDQKWDFVLPVPRRLNGTRHLVAVRHQCLSAHCIKLTSFSFTASDVVAPGLGMQVVAAERAWQEEALIVERRNGDAH
jgi:hypothetical protein